MLVLTRRLGEEIVIGKDIHLSVVSVKGGRVRLGVVAPQSVQLRREELPTRGVAGAQEFVRAKASKSSLDS